MMGRKLIEAYARLLPSDASACARLFAEDALFITHRGPKLVALQGREAIEHFLAKAPASLQFRVTWYSQEGPDHLAGFSIEDDTMTPVQDMVRYHVEHGKITRFEVV